MDGEKLLEERKKKFKAMFSKKTVYPYVILFVLIIIGYLIRIKNLKHLKDITTDKFIPLALDPFVFLRYAKEVLTSGSLAAVDTMRYYPWGYEQIGEFGLLSHVIVWLYKFLNIFVRGSLIPLERSFV